MTTNRQGPSQLAPPTPDHQEQSQRTPPEQGFQSSEDGLTANHRGPMSGEVNRRLNVTLITAGGLGILLGAAMLTQKWLLNWHNGYGQTFTISHMHALCSSSLGQVAQSFSGTAAHNCGVINDRWNVAVGVIVVGVLVAAAGIVRMWIATNKPAPPRPANELARPKHFSDLRPRRASAA